MKKPKPFTVINSFIQPDGTKLIMSMIENGGTPERKDTIFITEEERQAFTEKTMAHIGREMSRYYDENGMFFPNGAP